jgi:hypothetical protein
LAQIDGSTIISRLKQKFHIVEGSRLSMAFSKLIQGVIDVRWSLMKPQWKVATVGLTGTGNFVCLTVPAGKRWILRIISYDKSSGTWTVSAWGVTDIFGNSSFIQRVAAGTANSIFWGGNDIVLDAGYTIYGYCDSFTGAGDIVVKAYVEEEDLEC